MKILTEDIVGYYINGNIVSANHATADEIAKVQLDDIILVDDIHMMTVEYIFVTRVVSSFNLKLFMPL
jgi:hypothetical protein